MGVVTLLRDAERAGFRFNLDGDTVMVTGPRARAELVDELRRHKGEIKAMLVGAACCRCGSHNQRMVVTYWTHWRRALCFPCVAVVSSDFDRRGWPPDPRELIGDPS